MLRCKLPFGGVTADQMDAFGDVADKYAPLRKGHITTRQNFQFHHVPLRRAYEALTHLGKAGISTREACGNTVRNVTCCNWAGIAKDEVFDVRPYAQRVCYALLRKELTTNLPRKFKICFDGCRDKDCVQGAIHDVGLRAAAKGDADVLYMSGTGVHTIGVVGELEKTLGKPVITANLAALWGALERLGRAERFGFGESRLLEWQRARGATST